MKKHMLIILALVFSLGTLLQACGGDELVGDWVSVESGLMGQDGVRFSEDGTFGVLVLPNPSVAPEARPLYVELGTYVHTDGQLSMTVLKNKDIWSADITAQVVFEGDHLLLTMKVCSNPPPKSDTCTPEQMTQQTMRMSRTTVDAVPYKEK